MDLLSDTGVASLESSIRHNGCFLGYKLQETCQVVCGASSTEIGGQFEDLFGPAGPTI